LRRHRRQAQPPTPGRFNGLYVRFTGISKRPETSVAREPSKSEIELASTDVTPDPGGVSVRFVRPILLLEEPIQKVSGLLARESFAMIRNPSFAPTRPELCPPVCITASHVRVTKLNATRRADLERCDVAISPWRLCLQFAANRASEVVGHRLSIA
jgi:hypothetical protein